MLNSNYFALFNLTQQFDVDLKLLETNYRKIQSVSHPDRFITASATDKLQSMQTAILANEAYVTLKSPGLRASYLLGLQGIVAIDEKNNQMPADFLMQQMEWREAIEEAENTHNINTLENLLDEISIQGKALQLNLIDQFKQQQLGKATENTRKLIFMDKVCADIVKTIENLED